MSVVKVIEVIASSESGIEDAIKNALAEASRSVSNIESINVKNINVNVDDGEIVSYGVNCKISFKIQPKH